jgi:hypothetical protein
MVGEVSGGIFNDSQLKVSDPLGPRVRIASRAEASDRFGRRPVDQGMFVSFIVVLAPGNP